MTSQMSPKLRQEVDLIARFTDSFRRRFSSLIDQMNHGADRATDLASLRLCVEAVDMMLSSQKELCNAIAQMSERDHVARSVA